MRQSDVKKKMEELVRSFFQGATVVWVGQGVKPKPPYVTLKMGNVKTNTHKMANYAEVGTYYKECHSILEVNIYTNGSKMPFSDGCFGGYVDTSVDDLTDFTIYIESPEMLLEAEKKGYAISVVENQVHNLSELENNAQYRFRSMVELDVSWIMEEGGQYGIAYVDVPNSSGGGTQEMKDTEFYQIDEVTTIEEEEKANE